MLANHYATLPDAAALGADICTGWQGIDDDQRMLCTVDDALVKLRQQGITRGVLAIVRLGTQVKHHPSVLRRSNKQTGRVVGVQNGEILVDWGNGQPEATSHHRLVIAAAPANGKKSKKRRQTASA